MTSSPLAERLSAVKPSATLAVSARAAELRAAGKDVIGLGVGEPDFDTPAHIKAAGMKAIENGQTKYTAVDGTPELKQAIIGKLKNENGLDYSAKQILVSSGAKQVIYNLAQAFLNPGDEVIIPAPFWVSYPDIVRLAGATPVIIETNIDGAYKITPEQLASAITPKTRLLFLNSPSNPTGKLYREEELKALADVLLKHPNVWVMTDDIYDHSVFDGKMATNILMVCPELQSRTLLINGVSKTFAMTGWRIGYAAGPESVIAGMKKVQSQSTSNPCSVSQAAAVAALEGDMACVKDMVKAFKERHDYVYSALNEIEGFRCLPSDGTFYIFPNVEGAIAKLDGVNDDIGLAEHLLNEVGVALVPGTAFGAPGHVRLSFATSMDTLKDACERIKRCIEA